MRRILILVGFITVLVSGIWLGGESLLARQIRELASTGPAFAVEDVTPLRDLGRIGVRIDKPVFSGPSGNLSLEAADLWIRPLAPSVAELGLPQQARLELMDGPHDLGLTDPQVRMRFMPLSGFVPAKVEIGSGPVTLDEQDLASAISLIAERAETGTDAPASSLAAYDLLVDLDAVQPRAVPALAMLVAALPEGGPLSVAGKGKVWLDREPTAKALAMIPQPALTGLRLDEVQIAFGPVSARAMGEVIADAQGYAQGAVAIYTSDAEAMLDSASESGMIPGSASRLARSMIRAISGLRMPGEATDPAEAAAAPARMVYPEARAGELRLPIIFANGKASLGPVPLGAAPRLRP
ncbi:DUF2125 domain-containing protein [Paracoccus sp. MBLB3053]|uniref:DUF2125 domain-containing protein n=1 Tax=Paracoccus aurantius TaxID=3073814 RepID=A0ABU2HV57_9RHOB|nr:DUF2125 domain-containing protein [Paracoccus sp. MBLB3053]MDS9468154.1 DUF2125 domain-containing protein [Paracoccus sp. MBLB3053]